KLKNQVETLSDVRGDQRHYYDHVGDRCLDAPAVGHLVPYGVRRLYRAAGRIRRNGYSAYDPPSNLDGYRWRHAAGRPYCRRHTAVAVSGEGQKDRRRLRGQGASGVAIGPR